MDTLFPPGESGRIPLVALLRLGSGSVSAGDLARTLNTPERRVGLACAEGVFLGNRKIGSHAFPVCEALQGLLGSPLVDLAFGEFEALDVIENGLGFDFAPVVIVDAGSEPGPNASSLDPAISLFLRCIAPRDGTLIVCGTEQFAAELHGRCQAHTWWVGPSSNPSRELRGDPGACEETGSAAEVVSIVSILLQGLGGGSAVVG